MKYPNHYMIDIESTGVDKLKDKILQVAVVEMKFGYPYWYATGREFVQTLHYAGQPESEFAKKYMVELYKKCNAMTELSNLSMLQNQLQLFIHPELDDLDKYATPKMFMGWNASGFDLPFMFHNGVLTPSYYVPGKDGKDEMRGDVHYRIYEQTGSLQFVCNMTGLDSKTVQQLAMDLNPTGLELPEGKSHDALYDCYKQIIMQNGMIEIARKGIMR